MKPPALSIAPAILAVVFGCTSPDLARLNRGPGLASRATAMNPPRPDGMDFDTSESLAWGDHDLKIAVIGHAYDFMVADDASALQQRLVDLVLPHAPDLIVFGGDSIVGPRDGCTLEELESQWSAFDAFSARFGARTILVAGNHDGWTGCEELRVTAYATFRRRSKVNYTIALRAYEREIGLHFVFTADGRLPRERFAPIARRFEQFSENLVFGGHRDNGDLDTLDDSTSLKFKYFSGDHQEDNQPIRLAHVDAYNVTSWCDGGLDAEIITIGRHGTSVEQLGNCGRRAPAVAAAPVSR